MDSNGILPVKSSACSPSYLFAELPVRIEHKSRNFAARSVQLENTGLTRQVNDRYQVTDELFEKRIVFKESIAAKLREVCSEAAEKLSDCHSEQIVQQCCGCHSHRIFWNRCDLFYCPVCQPRLAWERRKTVEWWTKLVRQPKHVVLTIANTQTISKDDVREIKASFTRLRHKKFAKNWQGGFYNLEVTNEGKGWHLHIHALIEANYIDCRELAKQWNSATKGKGNIVKVKDARDKAYLAEVTKYAVKGSDLSKWEPNQIAEYILAFSGVRQFGVFGKLYKMRTEWKNHLLEIAPECTCPKCAGTEFRYHTMQEWEGSFCKPNPPPIGRKAPSPQQELKLNSRANYC